MKPGYTVFALFVACGLLLAPRAEAFCGFYVAKADAKLYNEASQVVLVRDGKRTVLTMANDFRGDPKAFAMVIPVPTVLRRGQIHVGNPALIQRIDAYTAPRLVEYFDPDPCHQPRYERRAVGLGAADEAASIAERERARTGVTVEARYTVGEYDILILSAEESRGLETWLRDNGYRIPDGAADVLRSYLKQGLKFFVAKVNLEEQSRRGYTNLRPLQIAFESPRFMLPIRLGTVNAEGPQELYVYTLTKNGRVETTNYRTTKIPSNVEIPEYVAGEFPSFYRAMFDRSVDRHAMSTVFLEYAWAMNLCDPCSADPLTSDELRGLGVFWLDAEHGRVPPVFVTRLHVRYDADHFPEDLFLQETGDRSSFQGRYVIRHPFPGDSECPDHREYGKRVRQRQEKEATTLASLTGWGIESIRDRIQFAAGPDPEPNWWDRIWNR